MTTCEDIPEEPAFQPRHSTLPSILTRVAFLAFATTVMPLLLGPTSTLADSPGDNTMPGANHLPLNSSDSGTLSGTGDWFDYWYVETDVPGDLTIHLSVPNGHDFSFYIQSEDEDFIGGSDTGDWGVDEEVSFYTPYVGRYYILVWVPYYYVSDPQGNYTLDNDFVPDTHPDLRPTIDALDEPWEWGTEVTVIITVTNEGVVAANSSTVRLKASSDAVYGDADDYQVTSWTTGPLDIGEIWTKTNTWTLPGYPYGAMPNEGQVYWYAAVDPVSGEEDTADNTAFDAVTMSRANREPTLAIASGPQGTITYNDVTFSYNGVDIDGTVVGYEVKLNGSTTATNATSVTYNDLANGPYTFEVRAQDDDGAWSVWVSRSFTVSVYVPPPPDFSLSNLQHQPSTDMTLLCEAETGYSYQLQYCDVLHGTWLNLGTPQSVQPGETELSFTDDTTATTPTRFYRVVRTPL